MYHFCTLFDSYYLPYFLAMYHSITVNCEEDEDFEIHAFCMDEKSEIYLIQQIQKHHLKIKVVSQDKLLGYFSQLDKIKKERSMVEFYFSCSPFICKYVLDNNPEYSHITYLDADLFFFNSPKFVYNEISSSSITIIEHKFYGWGKKYLKYGRFNVGWITFKSDENAKSCLNQWFKDCEEWCFDYYDIEGQRFGDQKYLDKWEAEFKGIKVLKQKGANLAPWNAGQYKISINSSGRIQVDEDPLIFYHFASLKRVDDTRFTTNLSRYLARPSKVVKEDIYSYYLKQVFGYQKEVADFFNQKCEQDLKRNRKLVNFSSSKMKLTEFFSSFTRWFFNDYIKLK